MSLIQQLLATFTATILPVALVATAGYVLASFLPLDAPTLGRVLFYLATPSLVFRSLYMMKVDAGALQHVAIVTIAVALASGAIGWVIGLGQDRRSRSALILTSAISNNGNMGIPICLFAFGEGGLALGTIYYAITSFLGNTFGVMVASAGSTPLARALRHSLRAPVLYAAAGGLLLNRFALPLPETMFRAVDLLAGAAIPGMLILLGAQLRTAKITRQQGAVWRSNIVRLVAAPMIAAGICALLGIGGLERQVLILQAGMPTAVMTSVLATEFNTAPRLVAMAIFTSTLMSTITLSAILIFLT